MKYILKQSQISLLIENVESDFQLVKRFLEGLPPKFPKWVKGYKLTTSNDNVTFTLKVGTDILPSQTDEILDEIWQRIYIFTGIPVSLHLERF